jgi:F-type H+-transporting ATPase subunit epsilon
MATLDVHVVSPEREVWAGEGEMVVAKGIEGDVGILPDHAPMLIALAVHTVRITQSGGDRRVILVDGGFLHVTPGEDSTRVDVLAEHAALPEEIDAAAAQERVEELRRRAEAEDDAGMGAELAKAIMRAEYGTRSR